MDNHELTVEVRQEPGHVLVTAAGEMDIATVPQLRDRLAAPAANGRPLIVDLDRVTFIDASGLEEQRNEKSNDAPAGQAAEPRRSPPASPATPGPGRPRHAAGHPVLGGTGPGGSQPPAQRRNP